MGEPLRVLVVFGGASPEHGVSCRSAAHVVGALREAGHSVSLVGVDRDGGWWRCGTLPQARGDAELPEVSPSGDPVFLGPAGPAGLAAPGALYSTASVRAPEPIDVCFPLIHGDGGEDGAIQGLCETGGIPYVGASVTASACAYDKRIAKDLFAAAGLPQVSHVVVSRRRFARDPSSVIDEVGRRLDTPVFAKPSRGGSSIGTSKCGGRDELAAGLEEALRYDDTAIVESAVTGAREIECGVLGVADPEVTGPGEIVTEHEFYDFAGKYFDPSVFLAIPADVPTAVAAAVRRYAREAVNALGGSGMARVDFFYDEATATVWLNEVNTIPGFTDASMYPHLWEHAGYPAASLVDRLVTDVLGKPPAPT